MGERVALKGWRMRATSVCSYIKVTTTNTGCKSVITSNRFLCYNRDLRGSEKVMSSCKVNLLFNLDTDNFCRFLVCSSISNRRQSWKPLWFRKRSLVSLKGVGPGPTLAWPGWKQPDSPVEVDTDRLETGRSEAGVLKKLSLAGIAKLSRLKYRWLSFVWPQPTIMDSELTIGWYK